MFLFSCNIIMFLALYFMEEIKICMKFAKPCKIFWILNGSHQHIYQPGFELEDNKVIHIDSRTQEQNPGLH